MGVQPATGIANIAPSPSGDQANQVISGTFTAVGTTLPINPVGPFNLLIYAQLTDTLTVTAASSAFSVGTGSAGYTPGTAINSTLIPPGTIVLTYNSGAKTGTFSFPKRQLLGNLNASTQYVTGIADTTYLMGATVTGTGIPANATVVEITQASVPGNQYVPAQPGVIKLSAAPTLLQQSYLTFQLVAAGAVPASGSDAAALFTGYGLTYSATVQLEHSFDGGHTYVLCGIGGQGIPAQWTGTTVTPVSVVAAEVERGVLYRLTCAAYSSGTIAYRISLTGQAAMSLSIPTAI